MVDAYLKETRLYHENGKLSFETIHIGTLCVINYWNSYGQKTREMFRRLTDLRQVGLDREYDKASGKLVKETRYTDTGVLLYVRTYDDWGKLIEDTDHTGNNIIVGLEYKKGNLHKETTYYV